MCVVLVWPHPILDCSGKCITVIWKLVDGIKTTENRLTGHGYFNITKDAANSKLQYLAYVMMQNDELQ